MHRVVEPELLDTLAPTDRRAAWSRGDLRRLNFIMRHASIISRACQGHFRRGLRMPHLVELGAGDGTLLLKIARGWSRSCAAAQATLVDLHPVANHKTMRHFVSLNWDVRQVAADVHTFLSQPSLDADVIIANLFLHHFQDDALRQLFRAVASHTSLFVACEPRRSQLALKACRMLPLIGCNDITRHDAVVSVKAGFDGNELSALWPDHDSWELNEYSTGLFSHCFVAKRHA